MNHWRASLRAVMYVALLTAIATSMPVGVAQAAQPTTELDALTIGQSVPMPTQTQPRRRLLDFATHASRLQSTPVDEDPVFRQPSAEGKAALGRARKRALESKGDASAPFAEVFATAEGPTLARMAFADSDPRVKAGAIRAAIGLAAAHPRLFGFLPMIETKLPSDLVTAIVDFDIATGADAPILYAVDALRHPDQAVAEAVARKLTAVAGQVADETLGLRISAWLIDGQGPNRLRALIIRLLAQQSLSTGLEAMVQLTKDADALVAAEARAALARLNPPACVPLRAAVLADRSPLGQVTALRMAADIGVSEPGPWRPMVQAALTSSAKWTDPIQNKKYAISALAQRVLDHWDVK